jgi:hypothetical protein
MGFDGDGNKGRISDSIDNGGRLPRQLRRNVSSAGNRGNYCCEHHHQNTRHLNSNSSNNPVVTRDSSYP